ncbi:MAG: 2-succinyl-6-hydroxy-2,4-cyclohexadiene-1-carboxylate synthase [Pseudomonadales bacterium]|nr:2-succinyl-6-hydroxy-2,4-cyclohexadiene-1-carboxylate synthase [Pseudomonadales bacterium]
MRLAWREWGEEGAYPVLALHGWLDNAASFDALAPLLPERRIIALDLPGHGLSSHRGAGGTYNIWDDLPELLRFTAALGLERYALLGHSRGAGIATLLAAIAAPAVSSLVMLDGALVPQLEDAQTLAQLGSFAHDYAGRATRGARVFASVDEAIAARCAASGIDERAATLLVPRSLEPVAGGFRWRTDPRLRLASALKFTPAQVRSVLAGISAPTLIFAVGAGLAAPLRGHEVLDWYPGLERAQAGGCHHCHMLEAAPAIAARIDRFWRERGQA